jgi:hypothetical protein
VVRLLAVRIGLLLVLVLCGTYGVLAQATSSGVLTTSAPIFLFPDASRTPLATLPAGTFVRVLEKRGEWYEVIFVDRNYGDRRGFTLAANVRVDEVRQPPAQAPTIPPTPPSTRNAPITPATPTVPPQRRHADRLIERGFLSLNGGRQVTARSFSTSSTLTKFAETGTIASSYTGVEPMVFELAAGIGLWRGLGFNVSVTHASKPVGDTISAAVPNPFFFDKDRTVVGLAPDLKRQEIAAHLDASWTFAIGRATRLAVFGGPSYFNVTQGIVTDIAVTEAFPYDEVSFEGATTVETKQSRAGFNVGFDLSRLISRRFGVGMAGRYSRATFEFPIVPEQVATIEAGGVQIGAGVRLKF